MLYKTEDDSLDFIDRIHANGFQSESMRIFHQQYSQNTLYQSFANALGKEENQNKSLTEIPFLPISFFKTHQVITSNSRLFEMVFESSGTTGSINSKHYILNKETYKNAFLNGFQKFYGEPSQYTILALLPSYLERQNSSLVYMADTLMKESKQPDSGFYLDDYVQLESTMRALEALKHPTILLGVTYALLDFAKQYPMPLQNTIVMETGGMKGRHEEWTRQQVHEYLKQQWQLNTIHSEYGMTELLSQAYSKGDGIFYPSDTMKVFVRDINDPLDVKESGTGCLNIIDLANIDSCSFIATDDMGTVYPDGSFEVLGRIDHSALRGCSLMVL